jgi:amino acid permease
MTSEHQIQTEDIRHPSGFHHIRLDYFLIIVSQAILFTMIGMKAGDVFAYYILLPFVFFLIIISFIARRGIAKHVQKNGRVEITYTYDTEENVPEKPSEKA